MGVYIEPISLRCMMIARAPAMTPWSTVSLRRLRRALERKICSLSSSTRRSRSRSLTWFDPAVGAVEAGAGVAVGEVAAGAGAGVGAVGGVAGAGFGGGGVAGSAGLSAGAGFG